MFGYIVANEAELKMKEWARYRSYYCGLCRALQKSYGRLGQSTLSYDLTFVSLLHASLYEGPAKTVRRRCLLHPLTPCRVRENAYFSYAADMNLLLFYDKCRDDWRDEHKLSRLLLAGRLKGAVKKIRHRYPAKTRHIAACLNAITACEKRGEINPDIPAGLFGEIMAAVLTLKEDVWKADLQRLGFYLGKFIYLLDAYEDLAADEKNGRYNVLSYRKNKENFEEEVLGILTMMAAEAARAFERLPIVQNASILRNILYSGIWKRYRKQKEA